jgi:hypothetical protein
MKIAIYSTEDLKKISHDLLGMGGISGKDGFELSYVRLWNMLNQRNEIPVEGGNISFSPLLGRDRYDVPGSEPNQFWYHENSSTDVVLKKGDESEKEGLGTLVLHAKAEYKTEDGKPKKARFLFELDPIRAAFYAMLCGDDRPELQTAIDYLTVNLGIEPKVFEGE